MLCVFYATCCTFGHQWPTSVMQSTPIQHFLFNYGVRCSVTVCFCVQAEAFAVAFASAETCGCNVSASAEVHVFDEIWVEAVANAYAETCVSAPPSSAGALCVRR